MELTLPPLLQHTNKDIKVYLLQKSEIQPGKFKKLCNQDINVQVVTIQYITKEDRISKAYCAEGAL